MDTKNIEALAKIVRKWNENDYNDLKITTAMKYKLIALFLPDNCQKSIKQAQKNHAGYNKEGLSYLMPEAFANLFIAICKLGGDPLNELEKTGRVSTGAFHRLIEGQSEEKKELHKQIDELEDKLEGSGMMPIEEHNEKVNSLEEEIKVLKKHIEAVLTGYLEDKEELQNEIEELENKLDGKGMISKEDHREEMNAILEENKQLKKELEIQKVKTESRDKYWTDKMEYRKKAHNKEKEYFNTELEKLNS